MKLIIFVFLLVLLSNCKKNPVNDHDLNLSTTILYMEANNDLNTEVNRTINQIEYEIKPSSI